VRVGCLLLLVWLVSPVAEAAVQTDTPATPVRIAVDDAADTPALQTLDRAGSLPFPVAVRVQSATAELLTGLVERLDALASRKTPIWLVVPIPSRLDDVEPWREGLRRLLDRHGAQVTILELAISNQPADLAAFAVRLASTEARATADASVRVALGGERTRATATRGEVFTTDVAPYVDLLSVPEAEAQEAVEWLARIDPGASVVATLPVVEPTRRQQQILEGALRFAGSRVEVFAVPAGDMVPAALQSLAPLATILTHTVTALDDVATGLRLMVDGADATSRLGHRLLFDDQTLATYLLLFDDSTRAPIDVALRLAVEAQPVIYDVSAGERRAPEGVSWDAEARIVRLRTPASGSPLFVDFNVGATDVFAERTGVVAVRRLLVSEIIARHQVAQRLQDARVHSYIARATTSQHFRPTVADAGWDVVTENRYFVAGADVEWEELSFSVNGARWGADRPPFPLLQPEKILSLPLQLRFDAGYRYRLDGEARVNGHDCYVVRFDPARQDPSLYRGTVWIDRTSFARIRVQGVQGGLAAPVISNDETLDYAPPMLVDGQPVFLLRASSARQIVMLAGRNILVEKTVRFEDLRVNDPRFADERDAARAGERIMYRETDGGLRYYVKDEGTGTRVVNDRPSQGVTALAMGVIVDPSYAFPLPLFGIDYLDFNFGSPNSQLALLFGGVLVAGNIQRSKIRSTPLDASVDFFGIAVPSSDRLYTAAGELEQERVLTWPLSTGANLGWQYTPFQKVTGQYQLRFDGYAHDTTTSEAFVVPSNTITNGLGIAWEYRRAGFTLSLSGTEFRRVTWRPWGLGAGSGLAVPVGAADAPAEEETGPRYGRHSLSLSRDFYFKVFHKIHMNGAWFGGHDLDRFSKYQFGMFDDTRIHGVPGSGVRFAELAMARGSYSLNIFEVYRLDLFAEQAWGRDHGGTWEPVSGFGTAVSFRAPKSTILRADFGKSLLPPRFESVGSYTLQVMLLKPLR
jgi:hypothetical protein